MKKLTLSLNELCYHIAEFFGAAPHNCLKENNYLKDNLNNHKKIKGEHVVLLVSNGIDSNKEPMKHEDNPPFNILNNELLKDQYVLTSGKDRSVHIYQDTVDCINRVSSMQQKQKNSEAYFFQSNDYPSDKEMLKNVCGQLQKSTRPTFLTVCLNSSFLTSEGAFTQNILPVFNFIEQTKNQKILYLLTSRHEEAKKEKQDKALKPLVPFLIISELANAQKEKIITKHNDKNTLKTTMKSNCKERS